MSSSDKPVSLEAMNVFDGFEKAAQSVLEFLNSRIKMGVWAVSRKQDDAFVVLQHSADVGYGLKQQSMVKWSDTFCSRMAQGVGPRVAVNFAQQQAYQDAARLLALPIEVNSYIVVPIMSADGSLFGSLCAISPDTLPPAVKKERPMIEMFGRLLSTILARELGEAQAVRHADQAKEQANTDALTGLFNRRGFDELAAREEERCRRYGHDAGVISLDVNGLKQVNDTKGHAAGDELIRRAAIAITKATRRSDILARVGGDEFLIIAVECSAAAILEMVHRLRIGMEKMGVSAAIGMARRAVDTGFTTAIQIADDAMYADKRAMKATALKRSA